MLQTMNLTEISQPQKGKYFIILLFDITRIVKFLETESRMTVVRDWGRVRGDGELLFNEFQYRVSVWKD